MTSLSSGSSISPDYKPTPDEPYMNPMQLAYFRQKLLSWRNSLLQGAEDTIHHLQEEDHNEPDPTDRAASETTRAFELRTRDRARKLIMKIDAALERIEEGVYGYCQETGEPIGLPRLRARPIATLCLEAQEKHEKLERMYRDD